YTLLVLGCADSCALIPYTTLFRSPGADGRLGLRRGGGVRVHAPDRLRPGPERRGARGGVDRGGAHARPPARPAPAARRSARTARSEEHTSELQSRENLVCRLLLEK